ncbi:class I SAM-dependent methyltransferase [Specibacter cremeus]|uniref:class I SAM-dependent methyltransferase n=1 Tax=Specibacter cremeus TaxID=1629051 RepID=UPI000F7837BA|nr:methyltransferase [Specibacter cremeus]
MDGDPRHGHTDFTAFDFTALRRHPDVEAANLFAHDATDELLLAELAGADDGGPLAIVGDRYGALTLAAAHAAPGRDIRVHQDGRVAELALAANAGRLGLAGTYRSLPLGADLLSGAGTVLWQLPRGLDELDEVAALLAAHADPGVRVIAGGRVKHMTPAMNTMLGRYFEDVGATRAWRKSRALKAGRPLRPAPPSDFPRREYQADLGLWLCAHGGTFAGTRLDIGTRFLLQFADQMRPEAVSAIDLGCGNGAVAAALAAARPGLHVTATDQSAQAVASARATAAANGLADRVTAVQDDALSGFPAGSADLVVLNPPFHVGATVHAGIALKLFDAAARVLTPGGELWTVYNSHLDYRRQLDERVGPTWVKGGNNKFTVAVSVKTQR